MTDEKQIQEEKKRTAVKEILKQLPTKTLPIMAKKEFKTEMQKQTPIKTEKKQEGVINKELTTKAVTEKKKIAKVSERKKKALADLVSLLNKSKTIVIASTRAVPSSRLQRMRKDLKDIKIVMTKKNIMLKALEKAEKNNVKKLSEYLVENFAVLFSESDPYDIAATLVKQRSKARAKAGQIAPFDIVLEAGPTDLPPIFISELADLGIKTKMEGGKVAVREAFMLAKSGEKIAPERADMMLKLSIEPFSVGLEPVAAYDSKSDKIYTELKVDPEGFLEKLKKAMQEAMSLSVSKAIPTKETIKLILYKAFSQANALQNKLK